MVESPFPLADLEPQLLRLPSPVGWALARCLAQTDAGTRCEEALALVQQWLVVVSAVVGCAYLDAVDQGRVPPEARRQADAAVRNLLERGSMGDLVEALRHAGAVLVGLGGTAGLDDLLGRILAPARRLLPALQDVVRLRNEVAHAGLRFEGRALAEEGDALLTTVREVVVALGDVGPLALLGKMAGDAADTLTFQGPSPWPLPSNALAPLVPGHAYLRWPDGALLDLHPLIAVGASLDGAHPTLCEGRARGRGLQLVDLYRGGIVERSSMLAADLEARLAVLAPDRKYQRQPWLEGRGLRVLRWRCELEMTSADGDVRTEMTLEVQRILAAGHSSDPLRGDCIPFDQHDAPLEPFPDEVFALEAARTDGSPLEPEWVVRTETLREFRLWTGKPLEFDECFGVRLGFFEPLLLCELAERSGPGSPGEDYYEFYSHLPVQEFELSLRLHSSWRLSGIPRLEEVRQQTAPEVRGAKIRVITGDDGDRVEVRMERLPVGELWFLRFRAEPRGSLADTAEPLDGLRAARALRRELRGPGKAWSLRRGADGSIVLAPERPKEGEGPC